MNGTLTIETQYDNGDAQRRIDIGLDGLLDIEAALELVTGKPTPMQEVYDFWKRHEQFGQVREDTFNFEPVSGVSTCKIVVEREDPSHYEFNATNLLCSNKLSGKVVAEHPIEPIRADIMCEYATCKISKKPVALQIRHDFGGFRREYLRLLLPLFDRRGNVTALACAARHLSAPAGSMPATQTG